MGGVDNSDPGDELDKVAIRGILVEALRKLTPREENIIRLRFGLTESPTDHRNFPITKGMKQQIQRRATK